MAWSAVITSAYALVNFPNHAKMVADKLKNTANATVRPLNSSVSRVSSGFSGNFFLSFFRSRNIAGSERAIPNILRDMTV